MAYVPKDRDNEALMIHAGVIENISLPSLDDEKGRRLHITQKLRLLANRMKEMLN